jgi:RNA polymerase sigma-32 factor
MRTGATDSLESLSINLRRILTQLECNAAAENATFDQHQMRQKTSSEVGVSLRDVEMMQGRLSVSDFSLNATQPAECEGREWFDAFEDESALAAEVVAHGHDTDKLQDEIRTLESIGVELGLSKRRLRQLEATAYVKMRKNLEQQSREVHQFVV